MKKGLIALSLLVASNATAQTCIPKPDCADMGYTERSCEGGALKCPFDTTKLFCTASLPPAVKCDVGMIYTSTGECYKAGEERGVVIGIVVLADTLVMSPPIVMTWAAGENYMITVVPAFGDDSTVKNDMLGKSNSAALVPFLESQGETVSKSSVLYCNSYAPTGTRASDWYLPAMGELYRYIVNNMLLLGPTFSHLNWGTNYGYYYFWSSSNTPYANTAWYISFQTGGVESQHSVVDIDYYTSGRDEDERIRTTCFLDISSL